MRHTVMARGLRHKGNEMSNFKKGDEAFKIKSWDDRGVFYVERVTIQSWGKKQGTATRQVNGKSLKAQIYIVHEGNWYFPATIDAEAKALELAAVYIQEEMERAEYRLTNPAYHQPSAQEDLEYFSTAQPAVIFR